MAISRPLEPTREITERGVVTGDGQHFSECEVHAAYDVRMAWGAPSAAQVNSPYESPIGRVAQNGPSTLLEYWRQTKEPR